MITVIAITFVAALIMLFLSNLITYLDYPVVGVIVFAVYLLIVLSIPYTYEIWVTHQKFRKEKMRQRKFDTFWERKELNKILERLDKFKESYYNECKRKD